MYIIRPTEITDAMLTYCDVPETDGTQGEWSVSTAYTAGDTVRVTTTGVHKIYEALENVTGGSSPEVDVLATTPKWMEISATNRWKPFDKVVGTQASQADSMTYTLTPGLIDAISVMNLEATNVRIVMDDPSYINDNDSTVAVDCDDMKISAIDGTAFVDFGVADVLTNGVASNAMLEITDSAGKKITGYIKAAGTGETYGSNVLTNGDMELLTGWSTVTASLSAETSDKHGGTQSGKLTASGAVGYLYRNPSTSAGALYAISYWLKNVTSYRISAYVYYKTGLIKYFTENRYSMSWAQGTGSYVAETAAGAFSFRLEDANGEYGLIDDATIKQILTPSATGVTITSTPGGSTYNWASKDADFNYNDANGYTYKTSIVYDQSIDLVSTINVVDEYTYWFEPIIWATSVTKLNIAQAGLPPYPDATVTIIITNTGGTAKCGVIVVGLKLEIGALRPGPQPGLESFSTIDENATFGTWTVTKRSSRKTLQGQLLVKNTIIDFVLQQMALYESELLVWVGLEAYECLTLYGIYREFKPVMQTNNITTVDFEVRGVI